jgi:hypothetical protein
MDSSCFPPHLVTREELYQGRNMQKMLFLSQHRLGCEFECRGKGEPGSLLSLIVERTSQEAFPLLLMQVCSTGTFAMESLLHVNGRWTRDIHFEIPHKSIQSLVNILDPPGFCTDPHVKSLYFAYFHHLSQPVFPWFSEAVQIPFLFGRLLQGPFKRWA